MMPHSDRMLTLQENTAVQTVLRRYRHKGKAELLPCLHDVQAITGWLDAETCTEIGQALGVPLVQIHEVIEFYTLFYNQPVGETIVRVCDDPPCFLAGSREIVRACASQLGIDEKGGTSENGRVTLEIHPCMGHCEHAPYLMIDDEAHHHVQPEQVSALLRGGASGGDR